VSTAERLRALAEQVEADRARPKAERDSGATDGSLDGVRRALQRAADRLEAGDRDTAQQQLAQAAALVGDGWSFSSALGREVLAVSQAVR
jgi:predicted negative regulator of RcsB-dependent stress response